MTDPRLHPSPGRRRHTGAAFTLVELMVSIAMVLIIILGVNAIFKMASDTVNGGMAMSAANRESQAAQSVLYDDFRTAVITDGPLLVIRSETVPAFRNAADEQEDRDGNPLTRDFDDDNTEGEAGVPGEVTPTLVYNSRNHRIDRVMFFANHLFRRQTGTDDGGTVTFVDDGTSSEAYIWYGHLDQPDFGKALSSRGRYEHRSPGELPKESNPNNYYATAWALGRSVTLLKEQPAPLGMKDPPNYFDANTSTRLSPLSFDSQAVRPDGEGVRNRFGWSRFDLAQSSINDFKARLQFDISNPRFGHDIRNDTWYELLAGEWGPLGNARFQGYPYPDRPLTPHGVARTVPVFVRGCTQFTVEFAGDFLSQEASGRVVSTIYGNSDGPTPSTDGLIDFMPVNELPHPTETLRSVRRIRWYGMPRNVDLRDDVNGPTITGGPGDGGKQENLYDVIPLRDLLEAVGATVPADHFEHFSRPLETAKANYAAPGALGTTDPKQVQYYAAWGPDDLRKESLRRPKMLRITMTIDDPDGRITEGLTYEYVIDLQ